MKTAKSQRSENTINNNNKKMKPPKQPIGNSYSKAEQRTIVREELDSGFQGPTQSAQDRVNQLKNRILALDNMQNPQKRQENPVLTIKQTLEGMDTRKIGTLNISQDKDSSYNNTMQNEPSNNNSLHLKSSNKSTKNQYPV